MYLITVPNTLAMPHVQCTRWCMQKQGQRSIRCNICHVLFILFCADDDEVMEAYMDDDGPLMDSAQKWVLVGACMFLHAGVIGGGGGGRMAFSLPCGPCTSATKTHLTWRQTHTGAWRVVNHWRSRSIVFLFFFEITRRLLERERAPSIGCRRPCLAGWPGLAVTGWPGFVYFQNQVATALAATVRLGPS